MFNDVCPPVNLITGLPSGKLLYIVDILEEGGEEGGILLEKSDER